MALPDSLKVVPGTPIIWGEDGGAGVTHTLALDALAAHCYRWNAAGCIQVAQQFATWVRDWQVPGGYWFTEFAFVPAWAADAEREARAFVAYLEGDPLARRYAPFVAYTERGVWYWPDTRAAADPSLFVGPTSTQLTAVGRWYQH